jgi:hypothetical protein
MSSALAISAVSAVLQYYLNNVFTGLTALFGTHVSLSAKAPDLVQSELGTGKTAQNQVNLFLHQVTFNPGWRNVDQPWLATDGKTQLKSPPLALDLHYLLTVYGSNDWQAEGLLGYALMMLHQNPVMTREDIRSAFSKLPANYPGNPLSTPVGSSGLADQIEMIKIIPSTLGREEMAWLWTALKADYRPTFPFQVSVVLMQPEPALSLAFPVLHRRIHAKPIVPAQILAVTPPNRQVSVAPGDTVTVTGEFLSGASQVSLTNARLAVATTVAAASVTSTARPRFPWRLRRSFIWRLHQSLCRAPPLRRSPSSAIPMCGPARAHPSLWAARPCQLNPSTSAPIPWSSSSRPRSPQVPLWPAWWWMDRPASST